MTQQTKTLEELRAEAEGVSEILSYLEKDGRVNTLINDLLAALEQAQKANEWRDMDSAPREHGAKFLGWSDKYGQCLLNYNEDIDGYVERGFVLKDDVNIIKWQPLPPKPQSET